MNNMMKAASIIHIKVIVNTHLVPCKIATTVIMRPSEYGRKDVEDIEKRRSSPPLQARMQKEIYPNLVQSNRHHRHSPRSCFIDAVVSVDKL